MNIIWRKPDGTLAETICVDHPNTLEDVKRAHPEFSDQQAKEHHGVIIKHFHRDSRHHAEQLLEQGKIDKTWEAVAFDTDIALQ